MYVYVPYNYNLIHECVSLCFIVLCDVSTTKDPCPTVNGKMLKHGPSWNNFTGVMYTATWRVTVIFMEYSLSWPDLVGYPTTDNQL